MRSRRINDVEAVIDFIKDEVVRYVPEVKRGYLYYDFFDEELARIYDYDRKFAYRTPMCWWVFALSLAIVLVITISIVLIRCWKSANANPMEALKGE